VRPNAALAIEFADGTVGAHADPRERKAESAREEPRRGVNEKQGRLL
jgi:hypothetical protein